MASVHYNLPRIHFLSVWLRTSDMKIMKLFLMISVALFLPVLSRINVKRFRCESPNKTISSNFKCFAKAYSRSLTTFSILFFVERPLYDFKVSWIFFVSINNIVLNFSSRSTLMSSIDRSRHFTIKSSTIRPIFVNSRTGLIRIQLLAGSSKCSLKLCQKA
jgi:hypothetical protein